MSGSIHLILCDSAANDPGGKVHMLGAGWSVTHIPTSPHAVVAMITLDMDDAGKTFPLRMRLVGPDGETVAVALPDGLVPIQTDGELALKPPEDYVADAPVNTSYSVSIGPLPLPAGRYEWRISVGDLAASAPFLVTEPVAAAGQDAGSGARSPL